MFLFIIAVIVIWYLYNTYKQSVDSPNNSTSTSQNASTNNNQKTYAANTKTYKNNSTNQRSTFNRDNFHSKIVGVTIGNRQTLIANLWERQVLHLKREPNNSFDNNAIAIYSDRNFNHLIGYIRKEISSWLAPLIDSGYIYRCSISQITGGNAYNHGVNILLKKTGFEAPIKKSTYTRNEPYNYNSKGTKEDRDDNWQPEHSHDLYGTGDYYDDDGHFVPDDVIKEMNDAFG